MIETSTRAQAVEKGLKHYFTGKPCKFGHVAKRHVGGVCMECNRIKSRENYAKNPEYWRAWRVLNPVKQNEKTREQARKRYAANPEKCIAKTRRWQAKNPEKVKEISRARYRKKQGVR